MRYELAMFAAIALLITGSAQAEQPEPQRTYRIGNSLTWDSQPKAIEDLAKQREIKHVEGYHIKCGSSLQSIWGSPDEVCVKPVPEFGTFRAALADHEWDAVTIQPHPGAGSTLATDTERIVDFIKLSRSKGKNAKTVYYIYAPWPSQEDGLTYRQAWEKEVEDADSTPTYQCAMYFDHLYKRVKEKVGDTAEVRMICAGAVLAELDRMAELGEVPGYRSARELYRDRVHLNHVGRFVAGVTVFTTLFDADPAGLTCPAGQYGGGKDFNPQLYEAISKAVATVRKATAEESP